MSSFIDTCIEMPVHSSLANDELHLTVHRFENGFWALWHEPQNAADLGRILTQNQMQIVRAHGFNSIGTVINTDTLNKRNEWYA